MKWHRVPPAICVFSFWIISAAAMCASWWSATFDLAPIRQCVTVVALVLVSFVTFFLGYEITRKEFTSQEVTVDWQGKYDALNEEFVQYRLQRIGKPQPEQEESDIERDRRRAARP
ncbi:MAG TPA: hypothetical protein VGK36_08965 [Candidatus Angelobacter sp.]|jgi:hypothetical protein